MQSILCIWAAVAGLGGAAANLPEIAIDGNRLTITTATMRAVFDGPLVRSVRPLDRDVEFVEESAGPGIELFYLAKDLLAADKHQKTSIVRLSPSSVRIDVNGADSTRSMLVAVDSDTGDIRITPDGLSNRRGLRAVRWNLPVHPAANVILPCVNGLQFRSDQQHPAGRGAPPYRFLSADEFTGLHADPLFWNRCT